LPLLLLYTGARDNEICKLRVKDISREADIDFLSIEWEDDDDGQVAGRVKNALACFPEVRPRMSFESGYFQSLEWRRGHGTKGTIDRGDHRGSA
jgi:hypothetical protein